MIDFKSENYMIYKKCFFTKFIELVRYIIFTKEKIVLLKKY